MNVLHIIEEGKSEYSTIHSNTKEDLSFESGEQWSEKEKAQRNRDGLDCEVTDYCRTYINRVTNPYLIHPFSIEATSKNDPVQGKILSKIINDIEKTEFAVSKYYKAFRNQSITGYGYLLARPEYISHKSDKQKVIIEVLKPYEVAIDKSEVPQWAVITQQISNKSAEALGYEGSYYDENSLSENMEMSTVYMLETKYVTRVFNKGGFADYDEGTELQLLPGMTKRRVPVTNLVVSRAIEGTVLEDSVVYPDFDVIPVAQLTGEESLINSETIFTGMVFRLRDSQTRINRTNAIVQEVLDQLPNAPYVATKDQIEGVEKMWLGSPRKRRRVLFYNGVSNADGAALPPPSKSSMDGNLGMALTAKGSAVEDMARSGSITDAMLGAGESAGIESGVALTAKHTQGEISTAVYVYSFKEALKKFGIILLKTYAAINPEFTVELEDNQVITLTSEDLLEMIEECEISVIAGPQEVETKLRDKAMLQEIIQYTPQYAGLLAIEIVKQSESPQKEELIKKMAKGLPPEFQDVDENAIPVEAQQALQAAQTTINKATEQIEYLIQIVRQFRAKQINDEEERKNKLEIERMKSATSLAETEIEAATDVEVANIKAGSEANTELIKSIAEREKAVLDTISAQSSSRVEVDESMMTPLANQVGTKLGPIPPMADGPVSI